MSCCSIVRLPGEERHDRASSSSQRCSDSLLWFESRGLWIHLWVLFFQGFVHLLCELYPSGVGRVPQLKCTRLGLLTPSILCRFVSLKPVTCYFTWCLPRLFLEESANNATFSPALGCSGSYRLSSLPLQSWLIPPAVMKNPHLSSHNLV